MQHSGAYEKYDADCQSCHAASNWDNSDGGGGNLTDPDTKPIIKDLTIYSAEHKFVSPLTDQEVNDLDAFLESTSVDIGPAAPGCQP